MSKETRQPETRAGFPKPARPGGPVLIHAISGLGKSTLTAMHPGVFDADVLLYAAVAEAFPKLEPRAQLRAWRALCQRMPWIEGGTELAQWAVIRRAFIEPLVAVMQSNTHRLVVTSLRDPPWLVSSYYGVEKGRYLEHLRLAGRAVDNRQSEAMNNRLEGYTPLVRLAPGTFLGEQPEVLALLTDSLPVLPVQKPAPR
ncbi:MAG: hypothetical protein ACI8RZ_006496 [Myxococcota bacterium]